MKSELIDSGRTIDRLEKKVRNLEKHINYIYEKYDLWEVEQCPLSKNRL